MSVAVTTIVGRKCVLWVDDQYDEGAALLLTIEGFTVDCAATITAAFAMAAARNYDAIVIDQRLPDGSGLQLLEMLRKESIESPVMVLTGFGDIASAVSAIRLGAIDYREKPLIGDEWVESVRRLVTVSGRAPGARPEETKPRHALAALLAGLRENHDDDARRALVLIARAMSAAELGDSDFVACSEAFRAAVADMSKSAGFRGAADAAARALSQAVFHADISRYDAVTTALMGIHATLARRERPSVAKLAAQSAISAVELQRQLILTTGRTFSRWRSILAIKAATRQLASSYEQVAQIAYSLGYDHVAQFNREFNQLLSITPTEFRRLLHQ